MVQKTLSHTHSPSNDEDTLASPRKSTAFGSAFDTDSKANRYKPITRRRTLQIIGAAGAGAMLPIAALANNKVMTTWSGISLGADADIQLFHPDKIKARKLLKTCLAEITRLEKLFSLYAPDSTIARLNKHGRIDGPPAEFVELLKQAESYSEATRGAFDVTVQGLLCKDTHGEDSMSERAVSARSAAPCKSTHNIIHSNEVSCPSGQEAFTGATKNYSYQQLHIEDNAIWFAQPNMQITLNGIAQGYITDKVTALLKQEGVGNALVNLGEKYAIGTHPKGRNWRVGITGKAGYVELNNQAIATSSNGDYQHIIDPKTGAYAPSQTATVIAPTAAKADAMSTAFAVMGKSGVMRL